MAPEIVVAIIAALGGIAGSAVSVVRSSRLISYRVDQLEKKAEAYEKIKGDLCRLEGDVESLQQELNAVLHSGKKDG